MKEIKLDINRSLEFIAFARKADTSSVRLSVHDDTVAEIARSLDVNLITSKHGATLHAIDLIASINRPEGTWNWDKEMDVYVNTPRAIDGFVKRVPLGVLGSGNWYAPFSPNWTSATRPIDRDFCDLIDAALALALKSLAYEAHARWRMGKGKGND